MDKADRVLCSTPKGHLAAGLSKGLLDFSKNPLTDSESKRGQNQRCVQYFIKYFLSAQKSFHLFRIKRGQKSTKICIYKKFSQTFVDKGKCLGEDFVMRDTAGSIKKYGLNAGRLGIYFWGHAA